MKFRYFVPIAVGVGFIVAGTYSHAQFKFPVGSKPGTSIVGASAWDPANKSNLITLSQTTVPNDTATTHTIASDTVIVYGTKSYTVGTNNKVVISYTFNDPLASGGLYMGFSSDTGAFLESNYPGKDTNHSFGVRLDDGEYQDQLSRVGTTCGPNGHISGTWWLAVDFNNGNVWCSLGCVTWFGTSANPDLGTGAPYRLSNATYFPSAGLNAAFNLTEVVVINTQPSLSGCTAVTNFTGWG